MATEQQRYEVFVSSTYADLREERQRVTMTLLESDAFPTGMEIFPATDDDAWTLICRIIDGCDYYLLVIAGKYGSVNSSTGLSYTEMEYDYAVAVGKPVMAFIHGDLGALRSDLCESTDDRRAQLENFRKKVEKAKHVKYWKSTEDLAGQVALSYTKFVKLYPATGWVRADQVTSSESLKELLDAKARIEDLEATLEKTKTSAPAGSEELAQGSEEYSIEYRVSAKTGNGVYSAITINIWREGTPTWDAIFASIAPQLLQEAEEKELQEGIDRFLLNEYGEANVQAVRDKIKTRDDIRDDVKLTGWRVAVTADTFGTILVQLRALGLIRKSDRKRSVSDTGTYWALTPYGEARTVQLRAIKAAPLRGTAGPASAAGAALAGRPPHAGPHAPGQRRSAWLIRLCSVAARLDTVLAQVRSLADTAVDAAVAARSAQLGATCPAQTRDSRRGRTAPMAGPGFFARGGPR